MGLEPHDRKPNRLVRETSPYLRQHAYNPVDWFPWGAEAFAKARTEHKPIFLSIGYSTCHWCHVMERESFENADTATVMNQHFVCIKLDREERPDLDTIYMTAVQTTTGRGGWPMSVWLTPDLQPFYCGTYFPPDMFHQLLHRIHDVWATNHAAVITQAAQLTATLTQHAVAGQSAAQTPPTDDTPLHLGLEHFRATYDANHGGFGGAPKFPRPVTLNFLCRHQGQDMALATLRKMAEGGLFDQLGGGFHRYSVDDRWLVSHFEKMLYDQAQLVASYCDAYQITHDPFHADIARRTCDYVLRDLTSPAGACYSAEDADSDGVEGKFYVWTKSEIVTALHDKAAAFCAAYGVTAAGNWEHGLNVLHGSGFAAERAQLLAVRNQRIRPHRDDKCLTSWNGLMISAFSRAAQTLDEPRYRQAAQRAAGSVLDRHCNDGRLRRTPTIPAVLDDYACFATGLLDLYETDFNPQWLTHATRLADSMLELFEDTAGGGFFMTTGEDASVIIRTKDAYDGAEPSGNSVAALLLLRLAAFTDNAAYRQAALRTLAAFDQQLRQLPHASPQLLCALDFTLRQPPEIVLAGQREAPDTQALLRVVHEQFLPHKIVLLAGDQPWTESLPPLAGKATAYVCANHTCRLPTTEPAQLRQTLAGLAGDGLRDSPS